MSEKSTTTWRKPYADFPLSYHPPSGRLYKKIRGKRYYFGYASDWRAALDKYERAREDLYAGRTPRAPSGELTLRELCNRYLTFKDHLVDSGELSPRTRLDYKTACDSIIEAFGRNRPVEDLRPEDFERLRAQLARRYGPPALSAMIIRIRMPFNYAFDQELIDRPVRFGKAFRPPSKRVMRIQRSKSGARMFVAKELRAVLDAADPLLKAATLLGVGCGFGNHDIATLPLEAVDLRGGWVDHARPKTGVERRCWLMPETVQALRRWMEARPEPQDARAASLAFLTRRGTSLNGSLTHSPLTNEFRCLLERVGAYEPRRTFYALRHTTETIGGEAQDQVALDFVMGHLDESMASHYREGISDQRLRRVGEVIRNWLFFSEKPS